MVDSLTVTGLVLALTLPLAGACAPTTPTPALASHSLDNPITVPYPPPTPRVEELGERPSETAVWVDGQWRFTGGGYAWSPGAWVEPRPGWAYAPPTLVRLRNGELVYYEGQWKEPTSEEGAEGGSSDEEAAAEPAEDAAP